MRERSRRFYALHLGVPLVIACVLLPIFEFSDIDRTVLELVYDREHERFPWRSHWIFQGALHEWAKYAVILFAAVLVGLVIAMLRHPASKPWLRRIVYVLVSIGVGTALTVGIRDMSGSHCPCELAQFGGWASYTRLLETTFGFGKSGKCFPCGHASAGFSLVSTYFALRTPRPHLARWALVLSLTFGFVIGAGRVLQGAHFPSHVLATALLCWLVSFGLYEVLLRHDG